MPFIPVPQCVELVANYIWDSQAVATVLHYQKPGVAAFADLLDLAENACADFETNIIPLMSPTVTLNSVKVIDLDTVISPTAESSFGLPANGGQSGASLPNNVACVVTKRTMFRGRSFRGRIYHFGIPETSVTGNLVSGTYVTSMLAGYNALKVITTTLGNWEMVVVSRYTNNNPRESGIFSSVVSMDSDGVVDSQRRRLPGRGS